jgi:hypothetical protein
VDLEALLADVIRELEKSADPEDLALLHRLREGTRTPRDASDIADMIESLLVERAVRPGRRN